MTPQKFALQLYSRLTNANPELVMVFMKAGSEGAKTVRRRANRAAATRGVRTSWRKACFLARRVLLLRVRFASQLVFSWAQEVEETQNRRGLVEMNGMCDPCAGGRGREQGQRGRPPRCCGMRTQ